MIAVYGKCRLHLVCVRQTHGLYFLDEYVSGWANNLQDQPKMMSEMSTL